MLRRVAVPLATALLAAGTAPSIAVAGTDAAVFSASVARLNTLRAWAGLRSVSTDASLSEGCWLHARYMAENNYVGHSEDPANRWYTAAGARAAGASNCALGADGVAAINYWAAGPFHAVGMLDPELRTVGFGSYRTSGGRGAAALNVLPSLRISTASDSAAYPVEWPGQGAVIDIGAYRGGELPNPLAGTGYSTPSGLPLIVQFGAGERMPAIYSSHLCRDGVGLAHRTYGEATYRNAIESQQRLGRSILDSRDAVVLVPRDPLTPGTYHATIKTSAGTANWNFTVRGARTYLTMRAAPRTLAAYGDATCISGTLRGGSATGAGLAGRRVFVQSSADGKGSWKTVKTLTTSSSGTVSWTTTPRHAGYYRLRYEGAAAAYAPSTSAATKVVPRAYVGAPAPVRLEGRAYRFSGALKPRHTAGSYPVRVYAWRKVAGTWTFVGSVRARAYDYSTYTRYRASYRFPRAGEWRLRGIAPADAGHARSYSSYVYLTVR